VKFAWHTLISSSWQEFHLIKYIRSLAGVTFLLVHLHQFHFQSTWTNRSCNHWNLAFKRYNLNSFRTCFDRFNLTEQVFGPWLNFHSEKVHVNVLLLFGPWKVNVMKGKNAAKLIDCQFMRIKVWMEILLRWWCLHLERMGGVSLSLFLLIQLGYFT
jgi:hypothetical protein